MINNKTQTCLIKTVNVESITSTLQAIHFKLIKCVGLMNNIFSFQIMLCISTSFLFTFFTAFNVYKAFFFDVDIGNKKSSIASLYWCFYYNLIKILLIIACIRTNSANEEMAKLIYKFMNCGKCCPMLLQSFGNQVKGQSAKSSCGLFNFDLPLLGMVKM